MQFYTYGMTDIKDLGGPPLGSDRIRVTWTRLCVCGEDANVSADEEDLCNDCWLHLYAQQFADAMYEAIYE